MALVLVFFIAHWQLSVLMQSFFLHRYASHAQFSMSKGWERFFHLTTWLIQGASYLSPTGYAYMHRAHHAYSDTERDPHSPRFSTNPFSMMWKTKNIYSDLTHGRVAPERRFAAAVPDWKSLEWLANLWATRIAWGAVYVAIYVYAITSLGAPMWTLALLPLHFTMGPLHGAIVNWGGHKYGYRNFNSDDDSKNTLFVDVLCMGELFQNNHHKFGQSPTFAVRWFEIDPTYTFIRVLGAVGIIDLTGAQKGRYPDLPRRVADGADAAPAAAEIPAPTGDTPGDSTATAA